MSADSRTHRGPSGGRRWSSQSGNELPIAWSVDAADGPIQGPLALEFLRGRRLTLVLGDDQRALLIGGGRLHAVFGPGDHSLDIGAGDQQIPPGRALVFLTPGEGLTLRWTGDVPLRCGSENDPLLIGTCLLSIDDPHAFHDTFLAGVHTVDPTFTLRLIDRLVQGAVAALLQPALPGFGRRSPTELQAQLTGVGPEALADALAPCGLVCRGLALYTAHPPVDHERPRQRPEFEPEPVPMSGHSEDLRRN